MIFMAHADYIFMAHTDLTNLTKAASQNARSLPTLPLFIEGRAERSEAEGVPNEVRRKSCKLIYYALRL